jgi:chromosome segregation ATPase
MRRRGLSARVERHLERGEEAMHLIQEEMRLNRAVHERNTQAFERSEERFDQMMAAFDRSEQRFERFEGRLDRFDASIDERHEESKLFMRESNLRVERVVQELVKQNARFNAEQEKRTREIVAEVKDNHQESVAHRKAIRALIDRLPPAAAA